MSATAENTKASSLPATTYGRAGRELLEGVLLQLAPVPKHERGSAEQAIEQALNALGRWADSPLDDHRHLDHLDGAFGHLGEAIQALETVGSPVARRASRRLLSLDVALRVARERTIDRLVADQERMLRARVREADAPEVPFRASVGLPSLHQIPRVPLRPLLEAPPTDDADEKPPTLAELQALAEQEPDEPPAEDDQARPEAAAPPASLSTQRPGPGPMGGVARDCMTDIASLRSLRLRNDDEAWLAMAPFEERLLADIDAFVSLGMPSPGYGWGPDVLSGLLQFAAESPVPDSGRAFARTLVLGCIAGDDTVRAATMALCQADPSTHRAHLEAFALAPSPAIVPAMVGLLRSSNDALVCLALDVLRLRRQVPLGTVVPLLAHPQPSVVAAAARALGTATPIEAAARILEPLGDDLVDDAVAVAVCESLVLLGSARGLELARELLSIGAVSQRAGRQLLAVLATVGAGDDLPLLLEHAQSDPGCVHLLGWLGHAGALAPLVALLARSRAGSGPSGPGPANAAAVVCGRALYRITGATLGDAVHGEAEPGQDNQAPPPCVDPAVWEAYCQAHERDLGVGARWRFGQQYAPILSLGEVTANETAPADRRLAAFEVAVAARGGSRLELEDWVARQQAHLRELEALFVQSPTHRYVTGAFLSRTLRRIG